MMNPDKIQRQLRLEDLSSELGVVRYSHDRPMPWRDSTASDKDETDMSPGKELLKRTLAPFTAAIETFLEEAGNGMAGRRHTAVKYLVLLEPEVLAYIAARRFLNGASKSEGPLKVMLATAGLLEEELRYREFMARDKESYENAMRKVEKATTAKHRRMALRHIMSLQDVKGVQWGQEDKMRVGEKLLDLFMQSTGMVEIYESDRATRKTKLVLRPTPATQEWLDKSHDKCALLAPVHLPMIVEPDPWSTPIDGGYLNKALLRVQLVKTRNRAYLDELFSMDMPEVYAAVNAVQSTAWRVNKPVLAVMREVWDAGGNLGGLPSRTDDPMPPRSASLDGLDGRHPKVVEYKRRCAAVYDHNATLGSQRLQMAQKLWMADEFAPEEEIYFPHQLDFRGRIYPVVPFLNPQSDDSGKALLEFASGCALGESGVYWLAVHVANLFGMDKLPLDERVQWTHDNEDMILDSGVRPLDGDRAWSTADSPWQALAACVEWAGYRMVGPDYVSHVPVALDGSCSGLQHFSAMLRDEVGGRVVNLVPDAAFSDIYTSVAAEVQLRVDSSTDGEAAPWQSRNGESMVTRKIAKHPCMTYAYSATAPGMRDMILHQLAKDDGDVQGSYLGEDVDYFRAAMWLSRILYATISETVVAASGAMDWLCKSSRVASGVGLPMRWTTPVGLPVLQENMETTGKRLELHFEGRRVRVTLASDGKKLDKRKQASGISPNVIHSFDSAHLMATVNAARDAGMVSFAMIHDSFGTHAANAEALGVILRETFITQYTPDRLEALRDELASQLPAEAAEKLPPMPRKGSLDLSGVRESDFFFS